MTTAHIERLRLSFIAEAGDARLRELLVDHDPAAIVAAAFAKTALPVPTSWKQRASIIPDANGVLRSCQARGLRWIIPGDDEWPVPLADLDFCEPIGTVTGSPLGLWVHGGGDLAQLSNHSAGIVGARSCTTYGADIARDLSADLSRSDTTIISGAAYGIDAFAHRGALAVEKPTIAVMAGGVDIAYPRAHTALLERIAQDGCLVSEQPPGHRPLRPRFLARNRIIAAISSGTVIVEAAARSGALNTLNWADQLGRATMAVPGPITSTQSAGTHAAIRDGKAILVTDAETIIDEMTGLADASALHGAEPDRGTTTYDQWSQQMRLVFDALDFSRGCDVADIALVAHTSQRRAAQCLETLSASGFAMQTASGWQLMRRADTR